MPSPSTSSALHCQESRSVPTLTLHLNLLMTVKANLPSSALHGINWLWKSKRPPFLWEILCQILTLLGSITDVALSKELAGADVAANSIFIVYDDKPLNTYKGKPDGLAGWTNLRVFLISSELRGETASIYTDPDNLVFIYFKNSNKKKETVCSFLFGVPKKSDGKGLAFTWINTMSFRLFTEYSCVAHGPSAIVVYDFTTAPKTVFS